MAKPRLNLTCVANALLLLAVTLTSPVFAQTGDLAQTKQKAVALIDDLKYVEAFPLLEKIVAAEPDNSEMQFYLGFALVAKANETTDASMRRDFRVRARAAFVRAKQLGYGAPLVDALITSMPPDGSEGAAFSSNAAAEAIMKTAEAHFSKGELDDALKNYQRALVLDPKLYHAALFSGDVYLHQNHYEQAEFWYQRAISIDPNRETAYRYSATPLMRQRKFDQARDRYVEAYITEPYSRFAISGISQWAQATNTPLGHPQIDIPVTVTFKDNGDANISLDPAALGQEDGSFAWIGYGLTRTTWRKDKFAKTYPKETTYRHSLAEEADALRSVVMVAASDKRTKTLTPSLAKLKKLNDEGLLEAYLLLARADQGIAQDHRAYLATNRALLRRYVMEYVVRGGGN
ncbi:MAG TPA: tetratricopeptide repeat protein [Pyrinomonadaceae bacterium]|nr:tetratricopeptide repeat protein [Pyrinomonadaceae bacterium]